MQRLELPAITPKLTAGSAVGISITEPLATAVGALPVADLNLAIGTSACSVNLEGSHVAVGVDAKFTTVLDCHLVVNRASAGHTITSLEVECGRDTVSTDTIVVVNLKIGATTVDTSIPSLPIISSQSLYLRIIQSL